MFRVTGALFLAFTVISWGCGYVLPSIRLTGRAADFEALAGDWSGYYESNGPHARRGTIAFKLVPGEDHAHGDVRMVPEGFTRAYERYHDGQPLSAEREFPPPTESLTIRFVRAETNEVSGALDPYWDPDRECQAWTTFHGRIRGRVMEGTFVSIYGGALAETTGVWQVRRR